jgi:hypothetical protein
VPELSKTALDAAIATNTTNAIGADDLQDLADTALGGYGGIYGIDGTAEPVGTSPTVVQVFGGAYASDGANVAPGAGNFDLDVAIAGVYRIALRGNVNAGISGAGLYTLTVYVGGVATFIRAHVEVGSVEVAFAAEGIVAITAGQTVDLRASHPTGSVNLGLRDASLVIERKR